VAASTVWLIYWLNGIGGWSLVFNPWAFVGQFRNIKILFADLGGKACGKTDGRGTIWLERRLDLVERRCTLTHELFHIAEGHTSWQDPWTEREVRYLTARALVPFERILHCVLWRIPVDVMKRELRVTDQVIADRIVCLTDEELRYLDVNEAHLWGDGALVEVLRGQARYALTA
jgi:hypothetical protein